MANLVELIKTSKTIAIFSHINADGDAVGSVMATYNLCKDLGKQVFVFLQTPISENYNFLGINKALSKERLSFYDLAIGLDCPNSQRFGVFETEFSKAKKSISIDHHLGNEMFADENVVCEKSSSTSEILFNIFKQNNVNFTREIATCLYAGVASDTGRFMHSNTSANALKTASELASVGADIQKVNYQLFSHKRFCEFDIFRKAIDNVEFYENGKIAFIGITDDMLKSANATINDTFLIIDFVRGIDGVDIAVLMTENKKLEQMVSVRTLKSSAQNICKQFGGGGHLYASGCRIFVPFETAKKQMIEVCKRELDNE
jgi:phosphoesterase RecJ-like protein